MFLFSLKLECAKKLNKQIFHTIEIWKSYIFSLNVLTKNCRKFIWKLNMFCSISTIISGNGEGLGGMGGVRGEWGA